MKAIDEQHLALIKDSIYIILECSNRCKLLRQRLKYTFCFSSRKVIHPQKGGVLDYDPKLHLTVTLQFFWNETVEEDYFILMNIYLFILIFNKWKK